MEQFKEKFIEEALDLIQDLESTSLLLSNDPENTNHIEVIFRAMHSLKGGSAMFGFDKIDEFTHQLETIYDMVRSGQIRVNDLLLNITFKSIDHIKILLAEGDEAEENTMKLHQELLANIQKIVLSGNDEDIIKNEDHYQPGEKQPNGQPSTWYIQFKPHPGIFNNGTNPLLVIYELTSLGKAYVLPDISRVPALDDIDPLSCYTSWDVILASDASEDTIRDVFMFVDTECDLEIKHLAGENLLAAEGFQTFLDDRIKAGAGIGVTIAERWLEEREARNSKTSNSTGNQEGDRKTNQEQNIASIRVSSEKLDELINLVSELVTRQASLSLIAEQINNKELHVIAEDVEKISRRLRDTTFGIRLIPVNNMVTRFHRLVRELSKELDKDIAFITEGTDTELDKNIIEGLIDPLMHIMRNSIDHGIEPAEERKNHDKPAQGRILLKAFYSGTNVYIQVSDDGKGIDTQKLYKQAVKSGVIAENAELSEKELLDLIFLPGFSTSEKVTKVSGRGVGMDVVKRKISDLRGEISVDTSLNEGTTITIKLPLTLSIIDGLLVTIDTTHFVIPLASINKCFEFKHEQLSNAVNNLIYINDGHIPFVYLRKEFNIQTTPPAIEQVVVIEYGDMLFGLAVDHVIGEYQAVLTSLGKMFNNQDFVSGATILGDGTVALVVDPNRIIGQFSYKDEKPQMETILS
ncbi:MAG TPA: chemotaxis protein CheA [Bacteroidales bacterium]|nr:chemotaxis protein CheA [Bacteroidales bacterium]